MTFGNMLDALRSVQPTGLVSAVVEKVPFSHNKAAVYPWGSWSKFLVAGCPSSHQPTRIMEEMLESGGPLQQEVEFLPHFHPISSRTNEH